MFKRVDTLAHRLTLSYAVAFAAFLLAAFIIAVYAMNSLLDKRLEEDLEEDLEEFQMAFTSGGLAKVLEDIEDELKSENETEVFFRIVDHDREIFASDLSTWLDLSNALDKLEVDEYPAVNKIKTESMEYPAVVIEGWLSDQGQRLQIGESTEQNVEIMEILYGLLIVMSILVLPLAYGVGWWVSQQAVKGINKVSDAALNIEKGKLDSRVEVGNAGVEIRRLGDRFNAMAQRIRELVTEMQEMIDNIAHDLRSPVTRIRALAETLTHTARESDGPPKIIHACDKLIHLINTTLDVSEAEAGVVQGEEEIIELDKVTLDVCDLFEPAMEEKQLQFSCTVHPARIRGFPSYIQRLLANLLDNAVKYTPHGGKVSVQVRNGDDTAALIVEDTGIGIEEKDINRVFDRFYRGDKTRQGNGSGLGLSFCRAAVKVHKGTIKVVSQIGAGTQFILSFPVAK